MCLTYVSLCDGIGAVHAAWAPLGWRCAWVSEIEPFPIAVVERRWGLPNLGDMTLITKEMVHDIGAVDLVAGGTPCQSFSLAGLRKGLDDPRGNLALVFLRIVDMARPRWIVWENVPGILSSSGGRDFGCFLGAMGELGYGWCYRVLDSQFFGVPQRRRRVFVVGHLGDWRPTAAVLLEPACLRGNPAPRRKARTSVARALTSSTGGASGKEQQLTFVDAEGRPLNALCFGGGNTAGEIDVATCLTHHHTRQEFDTETFVTHPLAFDCKRDGRDVDAMAPTLRAMGHDGSHANGGGQIGVATRYAVRRLTPRECERLQGFPDDYTLVEFRGKPAADGPRYRALGNSMAVPVMAWIGARIDLVDRLLRSAPAAAGGSGGPPAASRN